MNPSLKEALEKLVIKEVRSLVRKNSGIKRVVLFSSEKGFKEYPAIEVLNYTQNRFLTHEHGRTRIEVISDYGSGRCAQEGDHAIDIGAYLKTSFPEFF